MYDVTIIGGGIVGLATGHELLNQNPALKIVLLEKAPKEGQHQTGQGVRLGRRSRLQIDRPPQQLGVGRNPRSETRVQYIGRDPPPRPTPVAVGVELVESDGEGIALFGARNIKGAGHRVAALGDLLAVPVLAAGVDGNGRDRVPGRNLEHWLVPADGVVVVVGRKLVVRHRAS